MNNIFHYSYFIDHILLLPFHFLRLTFYLLFRSPVSRLQTPFILYFVLCILYSIPASAQQTQTFIYMESTQYAFIDYLINSGRKIPSFVMQQPYTTDLFQENGKYSGFFGNYWQKYYGFHSLGDSAVNQTGLSGQLLFSEKGKYLNEELANRFQAHGGIHIIYPYITLGNRTGIDQEYKYDPNYAGDLSESENWLWGRVNDAYMNLNFKNFTFFIGRTSRNWGPIGQYSLLLSNYPYTYDHLFFSYANKWLKLSLIFSQLESLNALGYESPDRYPDSLTVYFKARKFLVGHRLDFRVLDNLQLAFSEMTIYGGEDRDIDLWFLNPMTFFYGLQRNDRKPNNGNWSVDVFYKPVKKLTLYGQLFIDDFIVNNEPGQNDRARFDDRLAVYASVRSGDLPLRGLNAEVSYNRVWNRTYQSRWTYENYHYRELGLGYPCASCEEVKIKLGYWGLFPLFIENEFMLGRFGATRLTDVNLLRKEPFPAPPVAENLANIFVMKYYLKTWFDIFLNVQYFREPEHYLNRLNEGSNLTVNFGFRLLLSGNIGFR